MDSNDAPGSGGLDRTDVHLRDPTPILVGRTRERESLRNELSAATGGHGRLCLVGGEAGIGKTTLARDLVRTATELGVRVLTGACYDSANTPPYGPWLDLFEACRRDPALPPAPAAFAGGQLATVTDQAALFADVRRFLDELAADHPALILLEDLHWADPASLDLLRHVSPHLRHERILLVLTYRSDELAAGSTLAQHLPALVREADARRIDLRPLDVASLRTLVASRYRLARDDEDRLVAYLDRHAEGNPFFATEILRTMEDDGLLQPGEGGWTLAALEHVVVPPLLRQVIDNRVTRLGHETRQALAIAAVIGQEVPLDLWADVSGLTQNDLLNIVDHAVAAHLLEAERDGVRVRFVHALTREALYEGVLPPRRRAWHLRVAEALLARAPADPEAIAAHLQQAGDPRAVEWLTRAGERAQRAYAWLTAAERFRAAASLLAGVGGAERERWLLLHRGSQVLRFAYPGEAIAVLDETLRLAYQIGDASMVAETEILIGGLYGYADRFGIGLARLDRGIRAFEAMPASTMGAFGSFRAWLSIVITGGEAYGPDLDDAGMEWIQATGADWRRSFDCWYLASAGSLAVAATIRERLAGILDSELLTRGGVRMVAAFARHGLAVLATVEGDPDAARRHWTRAREDFGDHHMLVAFTLLDELRDLAVTFDADQPQARRGLAGRAEAALGRAGGALRPGVSPKLAWLRCLVADGRWDEARATLDDLPPPGNCFLRRETTFARGFLARHRGEPEVAWAEIHALLPEGPTTEPGDIIHQEGLFLLRLAAGLCLDAGDLPAAEVWLAAHDRWLEWSGSVLGRAESRLAWGRYHQAAGKPDRARIDLADVLELATDPDQPLIQLGAHRLLGELDLATRRFADAEAHLKTALALADACEVPFERAQTQVALAELQACSGDRAAASTLVTEARDIFTTLGATPALATATALATRLGIAPTSPANAAGLTPRELEVLRLVAAGHSNPDIAARLFISRETARTHVSNILRKLEVGSRAEAVDSAHRLKLLHPA